MSDQDSHLSEQDIDKIADRVIEKFGSLWVDRDQHHEDHQWVHNKRESEISFNDSKRRIVEKIVGTAGAVGLMGLVGLVGKAIIDTITRGIP